MSHVSPRPPPPAGNCLHSGRISYSPPSPHPCPISDNFASAKFTVGRLRPFWFWRRGAEVNRRPISGCPRFANLTCRAWRSCSKGSAACPAATQQKLVIARREFIAEKADNWSSSKRPARGLDVLEHFGGARTAAQCFADGLAQQCCLISERIWMKVMAAGRSQIGGDVTGTLSVSLPNRQYRQAIGQAMVNHV